MDIQWATLVASVGSSSLIAAVLSVVWDYRRTRRSELIGAYSEWLEAINSQHFATSIRGAFLLWSRIISTS